jgi:hypothetical protein
MDRTVEKAARASGGLLDFSVQADGAHTLIWIVAEHGIIQLFLVIQENHVGICFIFKN